MTKMIRKKIL